MRPEKPSDSRSWLACNSCRLISARRSCSARCSAFAPPKSPRSSKPAKRRSRVRSSARVTLVTRVPTGDREQVPLPGSARERELLGRFAVAVEQGDTPGLISLLTNDAWLTMPPQPYEYQGGAAIARFIARERGDRRGANLRLVPTRANGQPAYGCYLPDPVEPIARAYGIMVLALGEEGVSAVTWFGARGLFTYFALPATLAQ